MTTISAHEGLYWTAEEGGAVRCALCPFHCRLKRGVRPVCGGRENRGGRMAATNYGMVGAVAVDPIEKKPLYHFMPGSRILSVGPNGCNMACSFCQNAHLSQSSAPVRYIAPERLAGMAVESGGIGVAYTYAEPLIWYEYLLDAGAAVREQGRKNVLVTNGLVEPEPFDRLAPLIDAMNIDLKSMDERFYRKVCKGPLAPVLTTIRRAVERGIHVELTNLLIPTLNDAPDQIDRLVAFVAGLGRTIPLHFSRYHPDHRLSIPATPKETLLRAARQASQRLDYVYVGNIDLPEWRQTRCPGCGAVAVRRGWFGVESMGVTATGACAVCGGSLTMTVAP
ncbi:MAG: AmmeMemoRadiSam system radical SAM enzyme [Nitrospinae bacterium]|nr:AmmeMemoRadiSam system radical SAM enzyme [Nitrospinota bacterium]